MMLARVSNGSDLPVASARTASQPFRAHAADGDGLLGPHERVDVDRVAATRRGAVALPRLEARRRPDDALAVARHPRLDLGEAFDDLRLEAAVAARPDVEQQIAALPGDLAERVDEPARRLPVRVGRVVAPAIVDRQARLPAPPRRLRRHELLRRLVVAEAGEAVVDQDVGLQRADHLGQLFRAPLLRRALPAAIEPDHVDLAVVRQQLADLREHEVDEARPALGRRLTPLAEDVGLVGLSEGRVVGMVPIDERVVDARVEAFGSHRVEEVAHDVAAVGRALDGVVRLLRVVHRVAVVVLRREDGVLHAEAFRRASQLAGVPRGRIEGGRG